ncbi:MAG: hypothetical protein H6571_07250 [Lewinellaceae bacterium]|nr:hypothetical protein [Lewinellaceae bacterium]
MIDKKIFLFSIGLLFFNFIAAQQTQYSLSDAERIAITPIVPEELTEIPVSVRPILSNQLQLIANSHGFGGMPFQPQFLLVARPVVIEKLLTSTAPAMIKIKLQTTLYIADYGTKTVFSTASINTTGLGYSDVEAYTSAIRAFNVNAPDLSQFVKKGRQGIVSFFNSRCDFILSKADMLENTGQGEAALSLLLNVPEVCKECFEKAVSKSKVIYKSTIERNCKTLVQQARAGWSAQPNRSGADEASAILALIPVDAKCAEEGNQLSEEIYGKMIELEQWDRKVYEDNREAHAYYLETVRKIGVAQAENQPDFGLNLIFKGWLW